MFNRSAVIASMAQYVATSSHQFEFDSSRMYLIHPLVELNLWSCAARYKFLLELDFLSFLGLYEWKVVFIFSFPVIIIEEILKFITRRGTYEISNVSSQPCYSNQKSFLLPGSLSSSTNIEMKNV